MSQQNESLDISKLIETAEELVSDPKIEMAEIVKAMVQSILINKKKFTISILMTREYDSTNT